MKKVNNILFIIITAAALSLSFFTAPHIAQAAVSTTNPDTGLSGAFSGFWIMIVSVITGYPGMIGALILIVLGIIEAKKHPIWAIVGVLLGAGILMSPSLTQSTASATFLRGTKTNNNILTAIVKYDVKIVSGIQRDRNIRPEITGVIKDIRRW